MITTGVRFFKIATIFLFIGIFSLSAQNQFAGQKVSQIVFSREEEKENYDGSAVSIIPEYFLLGTLRFNHRLQENQVDYCYYVDETSLTVFLKNYIQQQLNINVSIKKENGSICLFSVELAKIMNSYFDKNGLLDMSFFDSKEKIYSYLSGYYLRSGSKLGEDFYSFDRYNNIFPYSLLEKAGCRKIVFLRTNYHIPGGCVYYFEPSVPLVKYFEIVEKEMISKPTQEKRWIEELIEQVFDRFEH